MIRWCAYCHHFLQEEEPFDQYQMTYGVCDGCKPKIYPFSMVDQEQLEAITAFFLRLEDLSLSGTDADTLTVLDEGRALGIGTLDLLMGMLQPLLVRIGDLWAANKVTVGTEHRFSALVADLVTQVRTTRAKVAQAPAPALILVTAEGNYHTLGLQMAEAYFATEGIPILAVAPGLPTREVLDLVEHHRPRALGFSVALPAQMQQVEEVAGLFRRMNSPPRHLLVGGPAVRSGLAVGPPGVEVCHDLSRAKAILA